MGTIADSSKHSDNSQPDVTKSLTNVDVLNLQLMARDELEGTGVLAKAVLALYYDGRTEHNAIGLGVNQGPVSLPMSGALIQAEIRGAIDAIERFTDALVDEGAENFLEIKYRLIKELEAKK